jgi:cyclopropane-fatty-acyl-phospholipid synthase
MAITAQTALQWSEQGYVPDKVIRHGIKRLLAERLIEIDHGNNEKMADAQHRLIRDMREAPIALLPEKANANHWMRPNIRHCWRPVSMPG